MKEIAYQTCEDGGRTEGRDLDNLIEAGHIALARRREETDMEDETCSGMSFEG